MSRRATVFAYVCLLLASPLQMWGSISERADIIVAQDSTGNFTTIQAAIDSVPASSTRTWIILVKNGIYREKLYITKNNVALVGEDRDSTRIVYPELRRLWRAAHNSSDWGAAVINVGRSLRDLTLANLTIYNNYGSLYGDHDHQFAIRGGGSTTRIAIINCNILADGGDTLSLWNTTSGMYYHANCGFMGYVDYVCPRGWCYITDSRFYGYNTTASIWHDGTSDSTAKFVIRSSYFDGVPGFPLGRNHKDAQFYLLDCQFSGNMADKPIYQADVTAGYKWGMRYFYSGCHRENGDYAWFKDNLDSAYGGAVKKEQVTAFWTFGGRWDPERTIPRILTSASIPTPQNNAKNVLINGRDSLRWIGGRNAVSYRVYLGTSDPPTPVASQNETYYLLPAHIAPNTTFYWRVDVVTDADTISGPPWKFTTGELPRMKGSPLKGHDLNLKGADPFDSGTDYRGCVCGTAHLNMKVHDLPVIETPLPTDEKLMSGRISLRFSMQPSINF